MRLAFIKYHGLGNDFLLFDGRDLPFAFAGSLARRLCDRHTGVGADGVLLWTGSVEAPRMQVVNADGSSPEMCGNGLRCFVKFLLDEHAPSRLHLHVATGAGMLLCVAERGPDGGVKTVAASMGLGSYEPAAVPIARTSPLVDEEIEVPGRSLRLTAIGTGNPHGVTFDAVTAEERAQIGPFLSENELFPQRANIEFVQQLGPGEDGTPRLQVDVYERGCGWTQACGTGATAAVLVAARLGMVPSEREVAVRLPGGWLGITAHADGSATMRGPAVEVYRGEVDLDALG